jgi:large subunit ribosomal protein L1
MVLDVGARPGAACLDHEGEFMKHGKKYEQAVSTLRQAAPEGKVASLAEAVRLVKQLSTAKFDETVEVAARLGVDPRHSDQQVRGTVVLPHGTGKKVRILVLCRGDKEAEALEAGADHAGSEEYIKKIQEGWLDVDAVVATPDVMGEVGKLGRVLGPRGLMPNPKSGTVTFDVAKAVRDIQAGKIDFRVDKGANVQAPVGKASFTEEALLDNTSAFLREIIRAKPSAAKGTYLKSVTLSTTMGPGVAIETGALTGLTRG